MLKYNYVDLTFVCNILIIQLLLIFYNMSLMMKKNYIVAFLIVFAVFLGEKNVYGIGHNIRPITVKVISESDQKPLANLTVFYYIDVSYIKNSLGITIIDPVFSKKIKKQKYITDENGEVVISADRIYPNKLYSYMNRENIVVNLHVLDNVQNTNYISKSKLFFSVIERIFIKEQYINFYNPNCRYKGFFLTNLTYKDPGINPRKNDFQNFNYMQIDESLLKEKESIIIKLKSNQCGY